MISSVSVPPSGGKTTKIFTRVGKVKVRDYAEEFQSSTTSLLELPITTLCRPAPGLGTRPLRVLVESVTPRVGPAGTNPGNPMVISVFEVLPLQKLNNVFSKFVFSFLLITVPGV